MSELTTAQTEDRLIGACRRIRIMWPAMTPQGPRTGFGPRPAPKVLFSHADDDESTDDLAPADIMLDLRAEVTAVLNSWARVLVEDRELTHALPDGHDTIGMAQLIERHAKWWSGHAAASDILHELTQAAHDVTRAVFPHKSEFVTIGPCTNCGATVRARGGSTWVTCRECGCEGDTGAWINALTDLELLRPRTTTALVIILHRRLGFRVTDRTLRRWGVDGLIQPVPEPEIGPRLRWPRYDAVLVMRAVTRLYRACATCGQPWNGYGDVCLACRPHMPTKPGKARLRVVVGNVQRFANPDPHNVQLDPPHHDALYGPGRRCVETGTPRAWCLCATCAV